MIVFSNYSRGTGCTEAILNINKLAGEGKETRQPIPRNFNRISKNSAEPGHDDPEWQGGRMSIL